MPEVLSHFIVCLKNNVAHFSFLLSSWAWNPKCSANNHQTVHWRASGFSAPNSPVQNNKSSSALDSSFAACGWFPFTSSKTSCFFLERRTSLDLGILGLWECSAWSSCYLDIVAGLFEMIVALPAHSIRNLSSLSPSGTNISRCWAILLVFLQFSWPCPPQERIFSNCVGRILFFFTVFSGHCVETYFCTLTIKFHWIVF